MKLGTQIKIVRIITGMEQRKLAALIGVCPAYMSHFESGRMNPTEEELGQIRRALNWDATVARIKAELG